MTRYANMDALRRNLSPDVHINDDQQPAAYRLTQAKAAHLAHVATEHEEQVALFQWAAANEGRWPELACMFAVPNGGYRPMTTAANLAQEGVRAGVPDILLMCRRGRYGAMAVELKRSDHSNHPTPAQREWLERLQRYGYLAICCYGAQEAINAIQHYLSMDERGAV